MWIDALELVKMQSGLSTNIIYIPVAIPKPNWWGRAGEISESGEQGW